MMHWKIERKGKNCYLVEKKMRGKEKVEKKNNIGSTNSLSVQIKEKL